MFWSASARVLEGLKEFIEVYIHNEVDSLSYKSILETFDTYGLHCLPCFVLLVLLVAAAKILAVKAGTSIHLARLPCQPICLVGSPAALFCACY
jgi:hypothetical protein